MSFCPSCVEEVGAVVAMNAAAQLVQYCPKCESLLGGGALTVPLAATGTLLGEKAEAVLPIKSTPPAAPKVAEVVSLPTAKARPKANISGSEFTISSGDDVIGAIRNRLAFLEAEIAKRAGFDLEAKKLRKMLAASDRLKGDDA